MKTIRRNVFETNSSSTHSLTICSEDEYDKWVNGELWLNYRYNGSTFLTREEVLEIIKKDSETYSWITKEKYEEVKNSTGSHFDYLVNDLTDGEIIGYQNYIYDDYLSRYSEKYTSKSGDKIVVFGKYGYDG